MGHFLCGRMWLLGVKGHGQGTTLPAHQGVDIVLSKCFLGKIGILSGKPWKIVLLFTKMYNTNIQNSQTLLLKSSGMKSNEVNQKPACVQCQMTFYYMGIHPFCLLITSEMKLTNKKMLYEGIHLMSIYV